MYEMNIAKILIIFGVSFIKSINISKSEILQIYTKYNCCEDSCVVPASEFSEYCNRDLHTGKQCDGDLVWNECASSCDTSCGSDPYIFCPTVCVAKCDCPPGMKLKHTNSTECVKTCDCSIEPNCDENREWCRENGNGGHECTLFAKQGEICNGFTLPQYYEICHPDLSCEDRNDPRIVDDPGICTNKTHNCVYNYTSPIDGTNKTRLYNWGEIFSGFGENHCNQCACFTGGDIACTEKYCA